MTSSASPFRLPVQVVARQTGEPRHEEILSSEAIDFVVALDGQFALRRKELLMARAKRREDLASGRNKLGFLPHTEDIREDDTWRVASPKPGLADRRVEMISPPTPKDAVRSLNSGASTWVADFEDGMSPTWVNLIAGQLTVRDAIDRTLTAHDDDGSTLELDEDVATIVVRPRGWHLSEKNIIVSGRSISASLVDFGLYMFHCAAKQLAAGSGPYFCLPKLEGQAEARLWNDVFLYAQQQLGIKRGSVRATALIETLPAAFEMEEILYELRQHCSGLNAGSWDYIFSMVKTMGALDPTRVLPDRGMVTLEAPFLQAYTDLMVSTCHRRSAHAIGGVVGYVPQDDEQANKATIAHVREMKENEAAHGFDGSWVAHSALVPICREAFEATLGDRPNQLDNLREDVQVNSDDLLNIAIPGAKITEAGVIENVDVIIRYIESWLRGHGSVVINGHLEDASTAEISRTQLWQWLVGEAKLDDGRTVSLGLLEELAEDVAATTRGDVGPDNRVDDALEILRRTAFTSPPPAFFTPNAYAYYLVAQKPKA